MSCPTPFDHKSHPYYFPHVSSFANVAFCHQKLSYNCSDGSEILYLSVLASRAMEFITKMKTRFGEDNLVALGFAKCVDCTPWYDEQLPNTFFQNLLILDGMPF